MLRKRTGTPLRLDEPWAREISAHFKPGWTTALPKPMGSFFVCPEMKLLYSPIAKCACTSLKRLMVQLAELPHADLILEHGVHRVTDGFITGAQLKDYDIETVRGMVEGDKYYKFAVIRDPVRRVVSAYTEKFLLNRLNSGNLIHTLDVVRTIRCASRPDLVRGISFREFAEYLMSTDPLDLDPHWMPQHLYLKGVNHFDAIFTMEQLDLLAARLSELTGRNIELGKHNISLAGKRSGSAPGDGLLCDTLPIDLDGHHDLGATDFLTSDLWQSLEQYYAEDVALYLKCSSAPRHYTPAPINWNNELGATSKRPLTTAPDIAACVSLFSKGFFALDAEGSGRMRVLVLNTRQYTLDFRSLPSCGLSYVLRDRDGLSVFSSLPQALDLEVLEAGEMAEATLDIHVPEALWARMQSILLTLHFGPSFHVEDVSPLHAAAAQLVAMPVAHRAESQANA